MLMRALCVCVFSIAIAAIGGCSQNDEVRSGMLSDAQSDGRDTANNDRHDDGDDDVQVTFADCPPAVQATITAHLDGGTINEIERSSKGNFEVEVNSANGQFEFAVAGDGTYLGGEDDDGDDDDDDDDEDDDR